MAELGLSEVVHLQPVLLTKDTLLQKQTPGSGELAWGLGPWDRGLKDTRADPHTRLWPPHVAFPTHRAPAAASPPAGAARLRLPPGGRALGVAPGKAEEALLLGAVVRGEASRWLGVLLGRRLPGAPDSFLVPADDWLQGQLLHQELPIGAEEGQVLQVHQGPTGEVKVAEGL